MARGAWDPVALQVAQIAEVHRDPKKRRQPFERDEFNPYRVLRQVSKPRNDAAFDMLEAALVG